MKKQPSWEVPKNLQKIIDEEEMWEDERWDPLLLTVIGGTSYKGRDIPMAWQIEFTPFGEEFEQTNLKLEKLGLEPSGYSWAELIGHTISKYKPELAKELQFGDTEEETCVVWVESENSCKALIDIVWDLIYNT